MFHDLLQLIRYLVVMHLVLQNPLRLYLMCCFRKNELHRLVQLNLVFLLLKFHLLGMYYDWQLVLRLRLLDYELMSRSLLRLLKLVVRQLYYHRSLLVVLIQFHQMDRVLLKLHLQIQSLHFLSQKFQHLVLYPLLFLL